MEYIGVNSFRFSISWARFLPSKIYTHTHTYIFFFVFLKLKLICNLKFETEGRFGKVNMAGIKHYNKLINTLLHKVTLIFFNFKCFSYFISYLYALQNPICIFTYLFVCWFVCFFCFFPSPSTI